MIAKQIKNKNKNSKYAAATLHNKVYRTITRHLCQPAKKLITIMYKFYRMSCKWCANWR